MGKIIDISDIDKKNVQSNNNSYYICGIKIKLKSNGRNIRCWVFTQRFTIWSGR